jgi:hypothetical protein
MTGPKIRGSGKSPVDAIGTEPAGRWHCSGAEGLNSRIGAAGLDSRRGTEGLNSRRGAEGLDSRGGTEGLNSRRGAEGLDSRRGTEGFNSRRGTEGLNSRGGAEGFNSRGANEELDRCSVIVISTPASVSLPKRVGLLPCALPMLEILFCSGGLDSPFETTESRFFLRCLSTSCC